MAITLVTTPAAVNANSYASVAEANTYHESRLHNESWEGASTAEKSAALAWSTRMLDLLVEWVWWPTTTTQVLQWPRNGVTAANKLAVVPNMTIPQEVKNATAELARLLIEGDRTIESDASVQGLRSLTAGPISLSFRDDIAIKVVPEQVITLIPPHWYRSYGARRGIVPLGRA